MKKICLLLGILVQHFAFAQFTDSFTDGDFTANPVWSGSNAGADFTVLSSQLRSNSSVASSNFYLSTASAVANNCQWEFWCNLQFNTSSANYVDVYLVSDQSDLQSASINGYFVRLGGTLDEICLYKRTGTTGTSVKIIDGLDGILNTSNTTVKIKVIRTAANLFTLDRDLGGTGTAYVNEGSVTDAAITSSANFGIFIQQSTATFQFKHFFDDFYVGPIILDVTPPAISSVTVISSTQIDILFNEAVDLSTSQAGSNYVVNNSIGAASVATRDASNFKLVHLTFGASFTSGLQNTVTINNVQDVSGNAISGATANFTYYLMLPAAFKDVIANEVMIDVNPVPAGVPAVQYLEFYNRSAAYFNLNGWQIKDGASTWYTISGNHLLAPGSYVLVAKSTDTVLFTGISNKAATTGFPTFNQASDKIYIKDNLGTYTDSVAYASSWYNNATKAAGGWSLELINPNTNINCLAQSNWTASNNANGGTPGLQNSVYSTSPDLTGPQPVSVSVTDGTHITVCFNEAINASQITMLSAYVIDNGIGNPVSVNAAPGNLCVDLTLGTAMTNATSYTITFSGLGDCSGNTVSPNTISFTYIQLSTAAYKDVIVNEIMVDVNPVPAGVPAKQYLELYNRSANYFNLNGWQIKDATATWYTISSNYILAPNTYALIAKSTDTALFVGISNKLSASGFPAYNVTGDRVYIRDNNANYIDSINYTTNWYNDVSKSGGGWSLELMNPNATVSCTDQFNWAASINANGGTPGVQNSVYSTAPDVTAPQAISVACIDATHITICFNESISTSVISSLSAYSVNNGIGSPAAVIPSPDNKCVDLSLGVSMINATNYTISFSGLSDCSGNLVTPGLLNYTFVQLSAASYKDVIVSEILIDVNPIPVGVPAVQYLELYNRSSNYFSLNGWQIKDATSTWHPLNGNYILAPNSYVVVAKTSDTALFTGIANKVAVSSFPSYNITSDGVYLMDNLGAYIDSFAYTNSWYNDATKANGGWSLELINPNMNSGCIPQYNWTASSDSNGGTPGSQNSVYSTAPDLTAPQPASVAITDATHITVCFNEAIDAAQLNSPGAYSLNNGIGIPLTASAASGNTCVDLTLSASMTNLASYTITFTGLADCSGNAVNPATLSYTYYQFGTPSFKDVIVNELMIDVTPAPAGVAATQYIELYNRSSNYFNLDGWQFSDAVSTTTISSYYLLAPNAYVVIAKAADTSLFTGITTKIGTAGFPGYNLSGDKVALKDGLGNFVDSLNYTDNWYNDPNKSSGGWSLELINPLLNATCVEQSNWTASNNSNGGTPGTQNSVYNISPDLTVPQLIQSSVPDSLHVSLCFSEGIPAAIVTNASNYSISNGIGSPLSAILSADGRCVDLTLSISLLNQASYTITLSNFADCSGNILSPNTANITYYRANKLDVLISEIMPDPNPTVGLPDQEYIELYNRSAYPVSLKNWTLSKSGSTSAGTIGDLTILPDSFIVLMNVSDTGNYTGTGIKVYGVSNFPSIDNATSGGKTFYLKNSSGLTISWVTYYTSTYHDANKSGGGYSLELIDPNSPCGGEENWGASNAGAGGTPGRQNSVYGNNPDVTAPTLLNVSVITPDTILLFFSEYIDSAFLSQISNYTIDNGVGAPLAAVAVGPQFKSVKLKLATALVVKTLYTCTVSNISDCVGNTIGSQNSAQFALPETAAWQDLVINEIMFDPNAGGQEWLEIYNRSDKTIDLYTILVGKYDTVQNAMTGLKALSNTGYLIFPQQYMVISENGLAIKSQYTTINPSGFLDIPDLPSLYTSDVVAISDLNENVIDYVKYTDKMHFSLLNSTKGVSLERIDFNRSGNDKTNWNSASSQVGFATPAYRNSQYLQGEGGTTVSSSPEIFSPDNDGYNDVVNINYEFADAGKVGNVSIYDSRGRFIRYLVKNELLGIRGTYSWNGIDQNNEKAPMGIYVIYFEVFDTGGKINKYKLTTVLGGKL
ncbi:MAG: lamin tail domain-containing protein [Bacteroidia bacterium]